MPAGRASRSTRSDGSCTRSARSPIAPRSSISAARCPIPERARSAGSAPRHRPHATCCSADSTTQTPVAHSHQRARSPLSRRVSGHPLPKIGRDARAISSRRSSSLVPRARAERARALARAGGVRRVRPPAARRAPVGVLRRPAHRQRQARRPSRARAHVQRSLSAFLDDAWKFVRRKAGWDTHGLPVEFYIRSKRSVPSWTRAGSRPKSASRNLSAAAGKASFAMWSDWNAMTERMGLLGRPRASVHRTLDNAVHRVGLVGAQDDPRQRPALREAAGGATRRCCTTPSRLGRSPRAR